MLPGSRRRTALDRDARRRFLIAATLTVVLNWLTEFRRKPAEPRLGTIWRSPPEAGKFTQCASPRPSAPPPLPHWP